MASSAAYVAMLRALQPKGLRVPGNIDLNNRPRVLTPEGKTATVRSIGIGTDEGEVVIPTVSDDGQLLTNDQAIELYRRTGKHLGIFDTPENGDEFGRMLHEAQARTLK
jgi:hypothetical protein